MTHSTSGSDDRSARQLSGQGLRFNLQEELRQLQQEQGDLTGGRATKTLAKAGTLRVTLVRAKAGTTIEPSANAGEASLHVLEGRLRVPGDGQSQEVGPGELVVYDQNLRDRIEALQDSAFLVTVAWEEGAGAWDMEEQQGKL